MPWYETVTMGMQMAQGPGRTAEAFPEHMLTHGDEKGGSWSLTATCKETCLIESRMPSTGPRNVELLLTMNVAPPACNKYKYNAYKPASPPNPSHRPLISKEAKIQLGHRVLKFNSSSSLQ